MREIYTGTGSSLRRAAPTSATPATPATAVERVVGRVHALAAAAGDAVSFGDGELERAAAVAARMSIGLL